MADQENLNEVDKLGAGESVLPSDLEIRHGDYLRIAELTRKGNGKPYTSDYVRKVLRGHRHNKEIVKIARRYLKRQQKITQELLG